jgi:hypothetical protein
MRIIFAAIFFTHYGAPYCVGNTSFPNVDQNNQTDENKQPPQTG